MSTTQLFVELLVMGLGVLIWSSFVIAGVIEWRFNTCIFDSIKSLWPGILGLAYVFGILLDRFMFSRFCDRRKQIEEEKLDIEPPEEVSYIERAVMQESDQFNFLIEYNRTRSRICRAWFVNFLLIGVSFIFWQYRLEKHLEGKHLLAFAVLIGLSAISYWLGDKLETDHYENLKHSYEYIKKKIERGKNSSG